MIYFFTDLLRGGKTLFKFYYVLFIFEMKDMALKRGMLLNIDFQLIMIFN